MLYNDNNIDHDIEYYGMVFVQSLYTVYNCVLSHLNNIVVHKIDVHRFSGWKSSCILDTERNLECIGLTMVFFFEVVGGGWHGRLNS